MTLASLSICTYDLSQVVDLETLGPGVNLDSPNAMPPGILVTPNRSGVPGHGSPVRVERHVILVGALEVMRAGSLDPGDRRGIAGDMAVTREPGELVLPLHEAHPPVRPCRIRLADE